MENDYTAERTYQVFTIENIPVQAHQRFYGLVDTNKTFQNYKDAENWIQAQGQRYVTYSIIETFKKP